MGLGTFRCFKDDPAAPDDDSDICENDQFCLP